MTQLNGAPSTAESGLHDREIDLPRPAGRWLAAGESIEPYQRLVANPFLALLGVVGWFGLMDEVVRWKRLDLFFPTLGSVVLIWFLFQYHCLDCGATGWLARWRRHSCAAVTARRSLGRPRRFRGPSPPTQTALWISFIMVGAFYFVLLVR